MKIALVYDVVYPWVKGGGEKHLWELALALRQRGHEVHCFGMQFWPGAKSIEREGIWLHGVCRARELYDSAGKRSSLQPVIFAWGLLRTLLRSPAGRLDVIDSIVFPYFSIFAIALWQRLTSERTPWVITWLEVWGVDYWRRYLASEPRARFAGWIERLCSKRGNRHLCISQHQAVRLHDLLGVPADKIEVIARGLDVSDVPPQSKRPCRVLYLGRLFNYKNVAVILRALPGVLTRFPTVQFRVVGDGPELASLQVLSEELNLQETVEFVAPKSEAAAALREIGEAAILVQPSVREGQSLVVLEAQASGTPVIAALHPESAVSDFIESGRNGILVEAWNKSDAWADAILSLLDDSGLSASIAAAGRKSVSRFDWESAIVPQVEALYQNLLLCSQDHPARG